MIQSLIFTKDLMSCLGSFVPLSAAILNVIQPCFVQVYSKGMMSDSCSIEEVYSIFCRWYWHISRSGTVLMILVSQETGVGPIYGVDDKDLEISVFWFPVIPECTGTQYWVNLLFLPPSRLRFSEITRLVSMSFLVLSCNQYSRKTLEIVWQYRSFILIYSITPQYDPWSLK